jgi:flagellin
MIINRNLHALRLTRIVKLKNWDVQKTAEKVASGLRINQEKDDTNQGIGMIDNALKVLTKQRSDLGSNFLRLEHTARSLMDTHANVQGASKLTRDADVAEELVTNTKDQIILQHGQAQLAQTMTRPSMVLRLLGG